MHALEIMGFGEVSKRCFFLLTAASEMSRPVLVLRIAINQYLDESAKLPEGAPDREETSKELFATLTGDAGAEHSAALEKFSHAQFGFTSAAAREVDPVHLPTWIDETVREKPVLA